MNELTYFVPDILIRQRTRRSLAKQDYPPFAPLSQFEAFVVNLSCEFTSRSKDNRTNAGTGILSTWCF